MSLAAIEHRSDTLYVSTSGGWSPATEQAIRSLAERANVRLVAATDNNRQGDIYADRIRRTACEIGTECTRSRPQAVDWNEDLRGLLGGPVEELSPPINDHHDVREKSVTGGVLRG